MYCLHIGHFWNNSSDTKTLSNLPYVVPFDLDHVYFLPTIGLQSTSTLDVLALDGNVIDGSKRRESLQTLSSIKMLSMRENIFKGAIIAQDFRNLRNLERLILDRSSNLENEFFQSIGDLSSLKILSLSQCDINGKLPEADWFKLEKLEELNLIYNKFEGSLPSSFVNMTSLRILELSYNHFIGNFASNLASLTSLEYFGFNESQFEVPISFTPFSNHSNLKRIDVSDNMITGQIFGSNISSIFPNLQFLNMSMNGIRGSIPREFSQMHLLDTLDLSDNSLSGEIPKNISGDKSELKFLKLSNNKLHGPVFPTLSTLKNLEELYLDGNSLSGSINSFSSTSLLALDISNNHLVGKLPSVIGNLSNLVVLLLSNNHLGGSISTTFVELKALAYLDISRNDFTGLLPSFASVMRFIHMSNNRWGNSFPTAKEKVNFTTKKTSYTYKGDILGYMSGIDLSNNKLNGNIPSEVGNLTGIRALNLSYNDFIGQIPSSFSNLVQTESLDLSFNKLSGQIPLQLNRLSFLAVFSVAHNNLSGETPERKGQFLTFDESSYEDNPFLCGPPLPKSCNPYVQPHDNSPNNSYTDEDNCSFVDMFVFWTSFGVSCTSVLLVIAATLYINPYWRRRWFYNIEWVCTNCYYFIEDNILLKFSNYRST
ncbi:hypothetical protein PHAVU_008G109100 [Phaseolus vulgaris]|uniref:Leucine-rich repeat-containing N-terminal plant-type domain-containing protein n=1 Tax=Phaseolus vulgaris TaxID=3885 RepID=V7B7F1_PHAVU|nr:hypothetical protein PHAVU_008G109100g [Phaseolus vulgaris]ESW12401.1 hypothetical protein PHAVU_008G109100g [Phaseolus vulgaris]